MGIELDTMELSTAEGTIIAKMKAATTMRDRLRGLASQASSEGFGRTSALIKGAIAALDDEMTYSTQIRVQRGMSLRSRS